MKTFTLTERSLLSSYSRAHDDGEYAVILPDFKSVQGLRAKAYAFAKLLRKAALTDHDMGEYVRIIDDVAIRIAETEDGKGLIAFRRRDQDPALQALIADLGGVDALLLPTDKKAEESLKRVQDAMASARWEDSKEELIPDAAKTYLGKEVQVVGPMPESSSPKHLLVVKEVGPNTLEGMLAQGWVQDPVTGKLLTPQAAKAQGLK